MFLFPLKELGNKTLSNAWKFVSNFSNIFQFFKILLPITIYNCFRHLPYNIYLWIYSLLFHITPRFCRQFKRCYPNFKDLVPIFQFFSNFFKISLPIFQDISNFFKCANTILAQGPVRGPLYMLVKALRWREKKLSFKQFF